MSDCCATRYDDKFDLERAQTELEEYLRTGIKKSSRPLMNLLQKLPLEGKTLLDIGGGIGSIDFELFKRGLTQTTYIDISRAYTDTFIAEAKRRNIMDNCRVIKGDFPILAPLINRADLVVLDKVICCYDDYVDLVSSSIGKADKWYAYTIPRDNWWVKVGQKFDGWARSFRGDRFRTYIHPVRKIERLIQKAGFKKIDQRFQREWLSVVFVKDH